MYWLVQMTEWGMNVDGFKINKSDTEKLLGEKFDNYMTFDDHISDICKKASFGQSYTIHGNCKEMHTQESFFHFTV